MVYVSRPKLYFFLHDFFHVAVVDAQPLIILQVAEMSVELEKMTKTVTQRKADCERLLVKIVSQQRDADEKRKQVSFVV